MKEILQCSVWKLETRSMFMRLWWKGVDQDWCNTSCRGIFLLTLSLHAKWTLSQNQLSKAGVKLVAKGSAGSWTAPNSRPCSPLPWFAQAAHRWQHPHWCSHQWKQMAVGSSACSQPDGPAVHFTEALCHHSSSCLSPAENLFAHLSWRCILSCRIEKWMHVLLQLIQFGTWLCQLHQALLTAKMPADRHVASCLLNSVKVV